MKTLVLKENGLSKYIFEDEAKVTLSKDKVTTPNFIIADLNSANAEMIKEVTPPEDWTGNKYLLQDGQWLINPLYVEPNE